MQAIFNQYSYVFISFAAIVGVGIIARLFLHRSLRLTAAVVLTLTVIGAGGWLALRPGTSDVSDLAKAEAVLHGGRLTLLEFYSNYCVGCIAARTTFENIVAQMKPVYADQFNVLRVDIHTDSGRALREEYGFSYTPEFVVFDGAATELWRSHTPPTLNELDRVIAPGSLTNTDD